VIGGANWGAPLADIFQTLIHLAHPISGGYGQRIQKRGHSGHVLGGPSKGGELSLHTFDHRGLAYLKRRFTLVQVS
jgi:hypothetical protein